MKKRFLSLIIALAMMVGVFTPLIASAEADGETETLTVHKILMTKEGLEKHDVNKKGYDGNKIENIQTFFEDKAKEIDGVYFALKFAADYAEADKQGKYVKAAGTEGADKLKPASPLVATADVKEAVGGLTQANDAGVVFDTTGLKGKFEIDEIHDMSTYKGAKGETLTGMKAVPTKITLPLVNDKGIVTKAHVYPKNTEGKPQIDKNFLKDNELTAAEGYDAAELLKVGADYKNYQAKKATAKAEIGKNIPYEVKTEIPAKSNLAEAHWDDIMTEGLTYNKDLKVTIGGNEITPTQDELVQTDKGFSLRLQGNNLALLNGKDAPVTVELKYSATVNSKAIADIPEANDITFHYGNTPSKGNTPKPTKPNDDGEIKVEKTWDEGSKFVDGEWAKFKLVDANTGEDVKSTDLVNAPKDYKFEGTVTLSKGTIENYTWKYLNKDKQYKVVEVESKTLSDAEYTEAKDGTIKVTNHKSNNPKPLNPTEPKVVLGGKRFVKTDQEGNRLAGAEFYVKNAKDEYLVATKKDTQAVATAKKALEDAVTAYNALDADKQTEEERAKVTKAQENYNKVFKENATAYTWGKKDDTNVVVLTSDGQGKFEITGLEYGDYKLEEKTAPKGFAKLNGTIDFKVKKGSYAGTNTEFKYQVTLKDGETQHYGLQIKNKKVSIPQTGGIGTIIFTAIGLAIMASAIIAIKKRQATEAR